MFRLKGNPLGPLYCQQGRIPVLRVLLHVLLCQQIVNNIGQGLSYPENHALWDSWAPSPNARLTLVGALEERTQCIEALSRKTVDSTTLWLSCHLAPPAFGPSAALSLYLNFC